MIELRLVRLVRSFLILFASVSIGGGCAGQMNSGRASGSDLRGSIIVAAPEPRLLLAGPGWLLHVNVERRGPVTVYRVPQRIGTAADCRPTGSGIRAEDEVELGHASIYVRKDQSVCAAAAGQRARLSWHAQPLAKADESREGVASFP